MVTKLHPREKVMITVGLIALAVALLIYWGLFPLLDIRERNQRQSLARKNELLEMLAYRAQYETLQRENERIAALISRRPKNFSLFSYLDQLAGATGIKKNIVYMKPSNIQEDDKPYGLSRVEIKLDQVSLDQVSRFLFSIETSPNIIRVPRLSIKQIQQDSGFLEAVLQVETLET